MIVRMITVSCDSCEEEFDDARTHLIDVRIAARRQGWISKKGRDLCPLCRRRLQPD